MVRPTIAVIAAALALASTSAVHSQSTQDSLPAWLAGTWAMQDGSAWAEELWTGPQGGMMLGVGRTGFGPEVESWELTRIERRRDGRIAFIAQPRGGAAVEFPMSVQSEEAIEFANPAHDYPQRIRYWRQGQLLMAEASRLDGSRTMRWNYRPVASETSER